MMKNVLENKKVIIFDLDGTLVKSKRPLEMRMAKLLSKMTRERKVAVIGGGKFSLFREQILRPLDKSKANLDNLYLFPTNGAAFYLHRRGWRKAYERKLTPGDIQRIKIGFKTALLKADFRYPKRGFGPLIENRGTQVTFSALGQRAPLSLKKKWNHYSDIRPEIMRAFKRLLPGFEIREGGFTSIDVTKKGIDKGYAVLKFLKILRVPKKKAVFIGDALFPGGNDYSVKRTGIQCIRVSSPEETKRIIGKN